MTETLHTLERELRRLSVSKTPTWEPWLVYADYLSAQGDARGRLIGLEHQLATATLTPEQRRMLAAELDELRRAGRASWRPADIPETFTIVWSHGFVLGVTLPLAEQPLDSLARLLVDPEARLLSQVCLYALADPDEAELDDEDIDDEDVYADGRSPQPVDETLVERLLALELGSLSSLAIHYSPMSVESMQRLAGSDRLGELRELDLRYARLADAGLVALRGWPQLAAIEHLHLQRNRIGSAGAETLAAVPFTSLRTLDLRDNPLGPAGARALAAAPGLARLEALYLTRSDIGPEGAQALAQSPHLPFHLRRHWAALAS